MARQGIATEAERHRAIHKKQRFLEHFPVFLGDFVALWPIFYSFNATSYHQMTASKIARMIKNNGSKTSRATAAVSPVAACPKSILNPVALSNSRSPTARNACVS